MVLFIVLTSGLPASVVWGGAISIGATYAFGAVVNDIADHARDAIAGKRRPLVAQQVTVTTAVGLSIGAVGVAGAPQIWLNQPVSALVVLGGLGLGLVYSFEPFALQRRGWLGPAGLVMSYVGGPVLLASANGGPVNGLQILTMALMAGAVLVLKDVPDVDADRATGKNTPAVRLGTGPLRWIATGLALVAALSAWLLSAPVAAGVAAVAVVLLARSAAGAGGSSSGRAVGLLSILLTAAAV